MIDLQKHMDEVLYYRKHIKDAQEKLEQIKADCASRERLAAREEEKLLSVKASIKSNELELSTADGRKAKLEERKYTLTTEREVEAVDRELNAAAALIGTCEESLISLMDESDACEKNIAQLKTELSEAMTVLARAQAETDQQIKEWSASEDSHRTQYDMLLKNLNPRVQPKFSKLISVKPFKAVAPLHNSTCGACNCTIPAALAYETMKDDVLAVCSNCGRFIYSMGE
jgi:predicted  nucleic acid-binding Zn-ribbon protein